MATRTYLHQISGMEYVPCPGLLLIGAFGSMILVGSVFRILLPIPIITVLSWAFGVALVVWHLRDVQRIRQERSLTISHEGFLYQAYNGDVTQMAWDEITRQVRGGRRCYAISSLVVSVQ